MSSDRVGPSRDLLRNPLLTRNKTASPLTPRLAPNGKHVASGQLRATSPKRLVIKTTQTTEPPTPLTGRPTPPIRSRDTDKGTPLPLSRRHIPNSASSTPTFRARGTPTSRTASPITSAPRQNAAAPRLAHFDKSPNAPLETTPTTRARTATGTVDRVTPSPLGRPSVQTPLDSRPLAQNNMFIHADEAKAQDSRPRPPPPKSTSSFLYADGRQDSEPLSNSIDIPAPVMSATSPTFSLSPNSAIGPPSVASNCSAPLITQTTFPRQPRPLSALVRTAVEKRADDMLHEARRKVLASAHTSRIDSCASATTATSKPIPNTSPSHIKSSSISAIQPESPCTLRKRSMTWNQAEDPSTSGSPLPSHKSPQLVNTQSQQSNPSSPVMRVASPALEKSPTGPDLASEARRERKVLDLEISNSSLLAINRSLEREIKRHKTELKRFRRLSRAGRFSTLDDLADGHRASLGSNALPPFEDTADIGRPSSPFDEHAPDKLPDSSTTQSTSDDDDDDDLDDDDEEEDENEHENQNDTSPDGATHGSTTQTGRQRAKDEARLQRDLRRHRELLLDTAKTNRSLQRCLTWTEDLVKHGRKALDASAAAMRRSHSHEGEEEEELDGFETSSPEDLLPTPVEYAGVGGTAVVESLMDINTSWTREASENDTARTERDSGVGIVKDGGP